MSDLENDYLILGKKYTNLIDKHMDLVDKHVKVLDDLNNALKIAVENKTIAEKSIKVVHAYNEGTDMKNRLN